MEIVEENVPKLGDFDVGFLVIMVTSPPPLPRRREARSADGAG